MVTMTTLGQIVRKAAENLEKWRGIKQVLAFKKMKVNRIKRLFKGWMLRFGPEVGDRFRLRF